MNDYLSTTNNKEELLPFYNKQEKKNYYLFTTNNKNELISVYNTQQRGMISCLKKTTYKKMLPV